METPQEQPRCVIPIHKPTFKEFAFFFSSGVLVSIPFTMFFANIYNFLPEALVIIVLAPFIEELGKVFPLFYRHGETERSYIILGLLIGLGFGISEFVLYVAVYDVPFYARIPGIIFHASSAAITAYGIAKKKPLQYFLIAISLHVGNNYFAVSNSVFSLIGQVLILVTVYLLAYRYYHLASKEKMVV
jgi:RsiW-degrading membrane proteinase PrsW (M82 family)